MCTSTVTVDVFLVHFLETSVTSCYGKSLTCNQPLPDALAYNGSSYVSSRDSQGAVKNDADCT